MKEIDEKIRNMVDCVLIVNDIRFVFTLEYTHTDTRLCIMQTVYKREMMKLPMQNFVRSRTQYALPKMCRHFNNIFDIQIRCHQVIMLYLCACECEFSSFSS